MKKKFNLFNVLLVFVFFLIPFDKVYAATHTLHQISVTKFLSHPITKTYYISNGNPYNFNSGYGFFHTITDGGTQYLAYCLEDGMSAPNAGTGTIKSGFSELTNKNGDKLSEIQQELLKNVLAVAPQYSGTDATNYLNNADINLLRRIYISQIIIWEIMDEARTDYSTTLTTSSPNTYDFIKEQQLEWIYTSILNEAYCLTGACNPDSFGKTYVMHWSDSKNLYESESINIGFKIIDDSYAVSSFSSKYNVERNGKSIVVTSTKEIKDAEPINFYYTKGNSFDTSKNFKWFLFGTSGKQNLALSYFGKSLEGSLSVKTESGKFKITKKDSSTKKNLLGASFDIYKCNDTNCSSSTAKKITTADLTTKAISDDITIKKSGKYLFKEVKTPFSYEKVGDFYVYFTIDDNGNVTAKSDASFLEVQSVSSSNSILNLIVYNDAKQVAIRKVGVNPDNSQVNVNGATFQIKDSNGNLVKFISENGIYKYSKNGTITDLVNSNASLYKISLLPQGEYTLIETNVPYPYVLPKNQIDRETKFKIDSEYNMHEYDKKTNKYIIVPNATLVVENYKTKVELEKVGYSGKPLPGVVFELYDSKKQNQITIKSLGDGKYEYDQNQKTPIQLITNSKGKIVVEYLPEGTYYFKEVKTLDGYAIDPENEWTKFNITINGNTKGMAKPLKVTNAKGEFCFYKIDENGNYLSGGLFKLQVYNEKTSRFEDVALNFDKSDNMFTIDTTGKSDLYAFETISNGQTCFKEMNTKGRYRVVEIEAPEGFILPKISEMDAEIVINENGYAIGSAVIINKKITVGEGAEAQAELIINISTGQERMNYIIIISVLLVIITGLFIIRKKIDKK